MGSIPPAITNRAIRTIRNELEFLTESSLLAPEKLKEILSLLPDISENTSYQNNALASSVTTDSSLKPALPTRKNSNIPITKSSTTAPPIQEPTPGPATSPNPPPPSYDTSEVLLEALYDYSSSQPDDLTFKAGDKIVLKQKLNNDWWTGRNVSTNQEGMFPAQYVQVSKMDGKKSSAYDDNMMVNVAHEGRFGPSNNTNQSSESEQKGKLGEHGKKFGSKLGNAAIFGAGATIGSKIVNGIF